MVIEKAINEISLRIDDPLLIAIEEHQRKLEHATGFPLTRSKVIRALLRKQLGMPAEGSRARE